MSITPEQLRDLVFAGESAYKQAVEGNEAQAPAAQRALLQLQAYLSVRAAQSPAQQQQVAATLEQCTVRLHTLRVWSGASEARRATLARTLAKASCPEGFRFTNPKGFSLLEDLRSVEPFKQILQAAPSSQLAQQRAMPQRPLAEHNLAPPICHGPHVPAKPHHPQTASGHQHHHQQQQQQHHQSHHHIQQQQQQQQPGARPPEAHPPPQPEQPTRRSGFQVPSRSGHLALASAALRPHHAAGEAAQQPGHAQASQHAWAMAAPAEARQPGAAGLSWGAAAAAAGHGGHAAAAAPPAAPPNPDSKWGPAKLARCGTDDHVHQARQQQQQQQQRRQSHSHEELISDDEGADARGGASNPFQSAKSKLISDMRKSGQPINPAYLQQQPGGGPPPRQGLLRPGGRGGLGGRRPMAAGGQGGGVNKGFVPPFVKKALDGQNGGGGGGGGGGGSGEGEAEGPLSLRTREFLKLGPEDPLPEELAKLDPQLIEQVCNDIVETGRTSWDDIAGQQVAKKLIQEVVVWPLLNPHIFTGARAPPRGILLFGPPGTGKTLLGKAIASNIHATFFSISASSLTSKWIGEGEKMVRTLFAVAGWVAPSVIFIDEIDSLLSARKSEGEHEASRRLKTEMLVQMEGCDPNSAERRVLLIGATNRPEELDEAARRRMPKQLYIPLPDPDARRGMVLRQLGPSGPIRAALGEGDVEKVVRNTAGYSGSDMKNLIQEACQGPVRDAVKQHGSGVASLRAEDLRPVVLRDFQLAARAQKASVEPSEIVRYEAYNDKHGARILQEEEDAAAMEDDAW